MVTADEDRRHAGERRDQRRVGGTGQNRVYSNILLGVINRKNSHQPERARFAGAVRGEARGTAVLPGGRGRNHHRATAIL